MHIICQSKYINMHVWLEAQNLFINLFFLTFEEY